MSRTFSGHAWEEKCAKEKKMHVLKKQLLDKRQCVSQEFVIDINQFDLNELCSSETRVTDQTVVMWSSPEARALSVLYR